MAKTISTLAIKVIADAAGLQVGFGRAERTMQQFAQKVKGVAATVAGLVGAGTAGGIGGWAIKLASDLEQTSVAFEVMTGSAEKANSIINEMRQFGAVTPFQYQDLLTATKVLLQFGVETNKATGYVKMLSEVAAGDSEKLSRIALAFGQINATSRLMGQDLLQLVNAGFNPLQEISRQTGQSMADLKKQMEAGQISFQMVADAFQTATSEGGRFYQMNERMSQTLAGRWSTLKDNLAMVATEFGESMLPVVGRLVDAMAGLVRWVDSLDAASIRNTITITGFAVAFTTVLSLIPRIVAGFRAVVAGLQAMAAGQSIVAALSGPAGWARLAIAAGVAAGSVALVSAAFDSVTANAEMAANASDKVASAADRAAGAARQMQEEFVETFAEDFVENIVPIDGLKAGFREMGMTIQQWQDAAKKWGQELEAPIEAAKRQSMELLGLFEQRLITPQQFDAGSAKVKDDLQEALAAQQGINDLQRTQGVGVVTKGSAGAFSAVQAAGREFRDMATRQEAQRKLQQEANTILTDIKKELADKFEVTEATI